MSPSFDRVAENYDRTRGGADRATRFVDRLLTRLPPQGYVLDIGAGTGIVTAAVMQRRGAVYGIDIAPKMLALAAARLPGRVVRADAARLPFDDNTFAAAYTIWVLQHVDDMEAVLAEANRVLARGGRLVVITTNQNQREDDIGKLVEPVLRRLHPARDRLDDPAKLRARAESAGLRFETLDWIVDEFTGESPLEQVDRIETRNISMLWELSDSTWEAEIVPLLAQLRALPDPDRRRNVRVESAVIAFSKPERS